MKMLLKSVRVAVACVVTLFQIAALPALFAQQPAPSPPAAPASHRTVRHTSAAHRRRRTTRTGKPAAAASASSIKVWLNNPTGVYHYPGTRWYGRTKDGQFMSEADARKAGDRPAANNQ